MFVGMSVVRSYKLMLKKNYLLIYFLYFSFFLFNGPLEQLLSLYFEENSTNLMLYGMFLSIISAIHIVLPGLVGYISHRWGHYLISVTGVSLCLVGAIAMGMAPLTSTLLILFATLFACGRTVFNFSLGNAINHKIPSNSKGKFFAMRDLFLFGSISTGLFIMGYFTNFFHIRTMYAVFGLGFLVTILFIFVLRGNAVLMNNESSEETIATKTKDRGNNIHIGQLLKRKTVLAFVLINVGTAFYGITLSFLPLLGTKIGMSPSRMSVMLGIVTLINAIGALLLGHISDRVGRKKLYVIDLAFDFLPALVFAFTHSAALFMIGMLLTMVKDILAPSSFAYFYDCFPEKDVVVVQGLLSSISNFLSFVVPMLISILWMYSITITFVIGGVGTVFAAFVAIVMLPNVVHKTE